MLPKEVLRNAEGICWAIKVEQFSALCPECADVARYAIPRRNRGGRCIHVYASIKNAIGVSICVAPVVYWVASIEGIHIGNCEIPLASCIVTGYFEG